MGITFALAKHPERGAGCAGSPAVGEGVPMSGISENGSEKPKRGRPRTIDDTSRALYESVGLFVEQKTERGRQNTYYFMRALGVLRMADPEASEPFRWLGDTEQIKRGEGVYRTSILAE